MQDDSNIRESPKIKCLLRKNILLVISYTEYTKDVRFYLPLPVSLSLFTVSAFVSLTPSANILIFFTAIPQHPPSVSSIALDIQHSLKPFTVTSREMRSHAVMIHID